MSVLSTLADLQMPEPQEVDLRGKLVWLWLILISGFILAKRYNIRHRTVNAPFVGYRGFLEPTWLLRLRFIRSSRSILQEGYNQSSDSMFKIRRIGTDILMLPSVRIDELRSLTRDLESSVEPFMNDYAGELTSGPAFLQSDLQNRVVQQKLTPALGSLAPIMKTELDLAIQDLMPDCEDWVKVDIMPLFVSMVARISARIFLGQFEGRNEEWLTTTTQYTENLFMVGMILRVFPKFIRPLVAPLLPPYRQLRRNRIAARRIITSIIEFRKTAALEQVEKYEKPSDILQWMTDMAVGDETEPTDLAQRMLILSLSSIHTTAMTMAQALYDLIAHPEFIAPIESECGKALEENHGWTKPTLNRFRRLDSLLKESQRINPVFLVTFNRILHREITFSDGLVLPSGTRIAVPSHQMLQDSRHVPGPASPSEFDPFRYSRLREDPEHPENAQKYQFAMADSHNMAFGYGTHACPGRAYTSDEIKMVLTHMLLKYEWAFPPGQQRPKNFTIDTDMYPDRSARVIVRKRRVSDDSIGALL